MDFNFSNLGQQNFSSNATAHLKPYDIYQVNLTKIEKFFHKFFSKRFLSLK